VSGLLLVPISIIISEAQIDQLSARVLDVLFVSDRRGNTGDDGSTVGGKLDVVLENIRKSSAKKKNWGASSCYPMELFSVQTITSIS